MFGWGVILLIIALIAGAMGFTGIAGQATYIAKIIFGLAIALAVISFFLGRPSAR